MSTLDSQTPPKAERVTFQGEVFFVVLSNGQQIQVPTDLYPRLKFATKSERRNYRLVGGGTGLHWPDLDEDVSVAGLLARKGSSETPESVLKWLMARRVKKTLSSATFENIKIFRPKPKPQVRLNPKFKQASREG